MAPEPPTSSATDEGLESDERSVSDESFLREVARASGDAPSFTGTEPIRLAHFRIVSRLGAGGMGIVYRAWDEKLERNVALKILPTAFQSDPERRRRFLREARSAAAVPHPNIATVYEIGEAEDRIFIAMELVEGKTLRSRIAASRLSPAEALTIAIELLDALRVAHEKGVIHCDLKPDNIMIDVLGHVKVLDFGLAKLQKPGHEATPSNLALAETTLSPTVQGHVIGTPGYMAPEQVDGAALDPRADLFAFGVILYEMLTGERPFSGRTGLARLIAVVRDRPTPLRERLSRIPTELDVVVERCLAKCRDDRYASAADALDVLRRIPLDSRPAFPSLRVRRPRARVAWAMALGLVVVPAALLGARAVRLERPPTHMIASGSAESTHAIGLLDQPAPVTSSIEAAAAYRRALMDVRDGVRRPEPALTRAVQLDPEFAAAHLRLSMTLLPPTSTSEYGEALRFRATLDPRDLEILRAEEPVAIGAPPDLAEAERRYAALHQARPGDVEILMRLAAIRARRDPASARATFAELLALDPTVAGAELAAGDNAKELDDRGGALAHYKRCLDLSPMAARCLVRLAHLHALGGQCDVYAREVKRVLVLEPDDAYFWHDALNAALTTGASQDEVRAMIDGAARSQRGSPRTEKALLEGEVALWWGSMSEARDAFERAERLSSDEGQSQVVPFALPQRLAIAEEIGDEKAVAALTRTYLGARAATTDAELDALVLGTLRRHRTLSDGEIRRLRDVWRNDATDRSPAELWLRYEAPLAVTEQEALDALASGNAEKIGHIVPSANAWLGHLYLLAHRFSEAISRLELVASNCKLLFGEESHVTEVVVAAYHLGQAREGIGDTQGACRAYGQVVERWGNATPRAATADGASARRRVLGCSGGK
jgi:serine/threonine-protein kinase